jgi:hypothetical protein
LFDAAFQSIPSESSDADRNKVMLVTLVRFVRA